jgi:broad specificity phosphatase PhoE
MKLILIRPGCTEFDEQSRIQGTLNVPLSPEGTAEVGRTAAELQSQELDVVYASPSEPALETARSIAAVLELKVKKIDALGNVDLGLWQGLCRGEIKRRHPNLYKQWQEFPETVRPPQGETIAEARLRIHDCLSKLVRKHRDATIGLVVPEPLATVIRGWLLGDHASDPARGPEEHGQWETIEVQPQPLAAG